MRASAPYCRLVIINMSDTFQSRVFEHAILLVVRVLPNVNACCSLSKALDFPRKPEKLLWVSEKDVGSQPLLEDLTRSPSMKRVKRHGPLRKIGSELTSTENSCPSFASMSEGE